MQAHLDSSTAFYIGSDLAASGVPLPEDATPEMLQGFEQERQRRPRPLPCDRYTRKWLQLRLGAWRRNRVFLPEVTPQYLQGLDCEKCPISDVELTHSTMTDSDWSIDRIDNDAAYGPLNLMVMSTRVNRIKGDLTPAEILAIALRDEPYRGLSAVAWRRLAYCCAHFSDKGKGLARACRLPPGSTYRPPEAPAPILQAIMVGATGLSARVRKDLYYSLRKDATPVTNEALDVLSALLTGYAQSVPATERSAEHCFEDAVRWQAFRSWYELFAADEPCYDAWFLLFYRTAQDQGVALMSGKQLAVNLHTASKGYR